VAKATLSFTGSTPLQLLHPNQYYILMRRYTSFPVLDLFLLTLSSFRGHLSPTGLFLWVTSSLWTEESPGTSFFSGAEPEQH
jgi:hypothetical protein